jgi:hypothetical protein
MIVCFRVLSGGMISILHDEYPTRPILIPVKGFHDSVPLPVEPIRYVVASYSASPEMRREYNLNQQPVVNGERLVGRSAERKLIHKTKTRNQKGKSDSWLMQHKRLQSVSNPQENVPNESSMCL